MEDLSQFRKQIDDIDDKIVDLLIQRTKIVEEVGKYKSQNSLSKSFIRSGREAKMLRNLTEKLKNTFPPQAVATIWRMIISTSLATEQKMNIQAYATKNNDICYWQAREYYGSFIDIDTTDDLNEIINNVANGFYSIGVLPLDDENNNPWWIRPNDEQNDIYVFARIPFVESLDSNNKPVLAIANVVPEKTNDDISLIAIKSDKKFEEISNVFNNFSLKYNLLKTNQNNYLIEVNEYFDKNNEKYQNLQKSFQSNQQVRLLGTYASPIKI